MTTLRIATRKSPLALWQSEHVAARLRRAHPGLVVELVPMSTKGDKILDSPLAKVGGKFLALKGPRADEELEDAKSALEKLGGKAVFSRVITLPGSAEERTLVLVDKVKATPGKYPRQAGTPNRKPL